MINDDVASKKRKLQELLSAGKKPDKPGESLVKAKPVSQSHQTSKLLKTVDLADGGFFREPECLQRSSDISRRGATDSL
jgi:hypothetical protein